MESKTTPKKETSLPNAGNAQKKGSASSSAADLNKILQERTDWQDQHIERFLEMPLVDPVEDKDIHAVCQVVCQQTIFLVKQFKDLDDQLQQHTLVSKYKTLNKQYRTLQDENKKLAEKLDSLEEQKNAANSLDQAHRDTFMRQLSGKEHVLEEKEKLFNAREQLLLEKDKLITSKDRDIEKMEAQIKDLKAQLERSVQHAGKADGGPAKREYDLSQTVAELQKQCQALTDDLSAAKKAHQDSQNALQKQIKLNKMEIQELKAENKVKDDEVRQLKFQDSLSSPKKSKDDEAAGAGRPLESYNRSREISPRNKDAKGTVTANDVLEQSLVSGSENAVDSPKDGHLSPHKGDGDLSSDQQQILVNLVKVKDEEIRQLKMQLNNASLEQDNISPLRKSGSRNNSLHADSASPLRSSARATADKHAESPLKVFPAGGASDFDAQSPDRIRPNAIPVSPALEEQLQKINIENTSLEDQLKGLIRDNYDLKMQKASDDEEISQMRRQITTLKQPVKLQEQQAELRDAKARLYEQINLCQHLLIKKGLDSQNDLDQQQNEIEQSNRNLFDLDCENVGDLSRFLNWEVSHIQTIADLANQLRRLITSQEFRPILEVRRTLEQLLTPQQVLQAQKIQSLDQLADIVLHNFEITKNEVDTLADKKNTQKKEYEQRIKFLAQENQIMTANARQMQEQLAGIDNLAQSEQQTHEKVTQDAFAKMEELVALNDDLMKANQTLQAQAQQHYQDLTLQEQNVQKLQHDLNFYMSKSSQLEQQVGHQPNSSVYPKKVSSFNNNAKQSSSAKSSEPRARDFAGTSPMGKLKPQIRAGDMPLTRNTGMRSSKSPAQVQKQYEREVRAAAHDQIQSQPGRGRQPGHRQGQGKTQFQRLDISDMSSTPIEEGSKLNMLIEEYRKENDRCSKRINELQHKLNKSTGRQVEQEATAQPAVQVDLPEWLVNRIRNETTPQHPPQQPTRTQVPAIDMQQRDQQRMRIDQAQQQQPNRQRAYTDFRKVGNEERQNHQYFQDKSGSLRQPHPQFEREH